jgi:hypothetical protein
VKDCPFDLEYDYAFVSSASMHGSDTDPNFDVTIINTSSRPVLLTAVGVEIVCMGVVIQITSAEGAVTARPRSAGSILGTLEELLEKTGEAGLPRSVKVKRDGDYAVKISDVWSLIRADKESWKNSMKRSDDFGLRIELHDVLIKCRLPDPIYLQTEAPHRFALLLKGYCKQLPQHVVIRLFAQTNYGDSKSAQIYLKKFDDLRPRAFNMLILNTDTEEPPPKPDPKPRWLFSWVNWKRRTR